MVISVVFSVSGLSNFIDGSSNRFAVLIFNGLDFFRDGRLSQSRLIATGALPAIAQ